MSILNKFANVTIENETRISKEDQLFCEAQERFYKEALNALLTALVALKAVFNTYVKVDQYDRGFIDDHYDIRHTEDRMKAIKNEFISRICSHFQKTYNITIETGDIKQKYDLNVTYQNVIDEIFDQLGGFNFNEKAVKEIKEKISNEVKYDKIEVKNNKLTISSFIYIDHFDKKWGKIRMSYNCREKVYKLFTALSHFETGEKEILYYYKQLAESFREDNPFTKFELGYNLVQSIKSFQNGKVEIVFQTNQQAEEFKREYLAM